MCELSQGSTIQYKGGDIVVSALINESAWDRIVRVVLGLALLYLWVGGVLSGAVAIVVGIVGIILLITGLVGFCPLYRVLGFSTKE